jgi:hypothetical protein
VAWAKLTIGSNVLEQTSGVIVADGEPLVFLERGKRDDQLLLTCNVYDSNGERVGKLRRNAWAYNADDRFAVTTNPALLALIEREGREVVLEVNVEGPDEISIPRAKLYTRSGQLIEVTPAFLKVGGVTMSDNTVTAMGTFVVIEQGGLRIGAGGEPAWD